ncbi:hypothetical protein EV702DRAFT_1237852 [Suillus placidus]|uniref:Uncharacterized protein n=1 Tax=Suillus placidus TaxID=48579 RepID=A0A9P6ZR32_9AGAM|nr:hypothetical protein EV702DRAFT_1237852 [Suillus placidus]
MANGTIVPSKAVWRGEVVIAGIRTQGEFEVFDSGGGWSFLFGKPLLQAFKAVHEYETDTVRIMGEGGSATICNQGHAKHTNTDDAVNRIQEASIEQDIPKGGGNPPSREVPTQYSDGVSEARTDSPASREKITPVCIIMEDEKLTDNVTGTTFDAVPANFLEDDAAVCTRVADSQNPKRVAYIVKLVQYGNTLSPEEHAKVEDLVSQYADIFACSLSEVLPVPGAEHRLNILQDATFRLRVHQRALTPPQTQFLHSKIDEMLAAGIIKKAPPEAVKCCATTVLAQKAHEHGGLTLKELQHRVNEQCAQNRKPPAFTLPVLHRH